jgi:hypothetical protein
MVGAKCQAVFQCRAGQGCVLCCIALYCAVLCCIVLCGIVLRCVVLCCSCLLCVVLCCVVLCCVVLCCGMLYGEGARRSSRGCRCHFSPMIAMPSLHTHARPVFGVAIDGDVTSCLPALLFALVNHAANHYAGTPSSIAGTPHTGRHARIVTTNPVAAARFWSHSTSGASPLADSVPSGGGHWGGGVTAEGGKSVRVRTATKALLSSPWSCSPTPSLHPGDSPFTCSLEFSGAFGGMGTLWHGYAMAWVRYGPRAVGIGE